MTETLTQAVARFSTRSYLSTVRGNNLNKDAQFLLINDSTYEMKLDARRMPKLFSGLDSSGVRPVPQRPYTRRQRSGNAVDLFAKRWLTGVYERMLLHRFEITLHTARHKQLI